MACGAPLLSCRLASWIATANGRPSVSTMMCSFRPLIVCLVLLEIQRALCHQGMGQQQRVRHPFSQITPLHE